MFEKVINFWFQELAPKQWWQKDEELDATIAKRFAGLHKQASAGELFAWRDNAEGALAEVIVLDQFSRNIYRDTPQAFACDNLALALAQYAIEKRFDNELTAKQRSFLYMPFMHSESQLIHQEALKLYTALGNENNLKFEQQHKAIIDRFGRYPHRNKILGRASTPEEIEFLTQPNSSF
ncbi:DUF924 family protein [Thalassotalea euphylliae]|uniref:DUF924 domain-containing protein n=1 Tax=Thalassotalea euphylliae TaxID=1655234 RepID=A0A3E0TXX2_9GAMM|nr:DUF924 family protein [Thalassotalea euphylliae]REL29458.1 DUF924 domain-containing protein [Thalassotalea euphylliae]